jgi:hypothetical protein
VVAEEAVGLVGSVAAAAEVAVAAADSVAAIVVARGTTAVE